MNAMLQPEIPKDAARRLAAGAIKDGFQPVGLHVYHDADSRPWVYRIRCKHADGSKWMRPMHFDGSRFVLGEPPALPTGKPLYRPPYPQVESDPMVIVEGEACADALARLGITTTTSGGADSANAADWSSLEGHSALLWPDNDMAGAKYRDDVIVKLCALGCDVNVIDVDKLNLPDKGDVVDWLREHPDATAADVLALPKIAALMPSEHAKAEHADHSPHADLIDTALLKAASDPGVLFERDVLAAIREVRQSDPARFQRIRALAKSAKVSVTELDRLTMPPRNGADADPFPVVEPWADLVDGAALLTDIRKVLQDHVIADTPTLTAAALWAVHSWCMDVLTVSPLAHITSPEKRCGKTILYTALSRLVFRPLPASNISPSALFRSVELWGPTLLIDEADSFLRDNEEARGLINSGLYRETAFVLRCVGEDFTPTRFATWGAKALCGIGKLADTIEDRSIPLRLRRKTEGENVANIRRSNPTIWEALQSRIARWIADNLGRIGAARPAPVTGLNDRAQDCWEPLLAIADLAGDHWPATARAAATALHGVDDDAPGIGTELLADIRDVFTDKGVNRIASRDLLAALVKVEDGPWATWNKGNPLSPRQLAAKLKDFRISPTTTRLPGGDRLKGYTIESFRDAFASYLSFGKGAHKRDSVTTTPLCDLQAISTRDGGASVTDTEQQEMASDMGCHAVTDENTMPEREGIEVLDL